MRAAVFATIVAALAVPATAAPHCTKKASSQSNSHAVDTGSNAAPGPKGDGQTPPQLNAQQTSDQTPQQTPTQQDGQTSAAQGSETPTPSQESNPAPTDQQQSGNGERVDTTAIYAPKVNDPASNMPGQEQTGMLQLHNDLRGKHGANALTWNQTLADAAAAYADKCQYGHSKSGPGENLSTSWGGSQYNMSSLYMGWEDEQEDYKTPGFSLETGHYTQIVWKDTTTVGCGWKVCGNLQMIEEGGSHANAAYLVCQYWPPGNFEGQFEAQVA